MPSSPTTNSPTTNGQVMADVARATLEARRTLLLEAIGDAAAVPVSSASNTIGETEHLAIYQQRAVDGVRTTMLSSELDDITDALARLDVGTYGTCEACASTIAAERLEVVPAARFCVRCA